MAQILKVNVQAVSNGATNYVHVHPTDSVAELKRKALHKLRLPYSVSLTELVHPSYQLVDNRIPVGTALAGYKTSHIVSVAGTRPDIGIPLRKVLIGAIISVVFVVVITFDIGSTSSMSKYWSPSMHHDVTTLTRGDLCDHASLTALHVPTHISTPSQPGRLTSPQPGGGASLGDTAQSTHGGTPPDVPPDDINAQGVVREDGRRQVAIAVTLTKNDGAEGYVDCAAALRESVLRWQQTSRFHIDFVAFVKPDLPKRAVAKLLAFGFHVKEADVPYVRWDGLPMGWYKAHVNETGCCGFDELIKLNAYTLTEYYRVIHIDTDAMILQNVDEILDADPQLSLIYTPGAMPGELFSGGLMILRPSLHVLKRITNVLQKGDFRQGVGWEGSGIGWYWGGFTIQGIMPFFYKKKMPSTRSKTIDYCIYNCQSQDRCSGTPWKDVKIWQFSMCMKPFTCRIPGKHLCRESHDSWWALTAEALKTAQLPELERCTRGVYQNVVIDTGRVDTLYREWETSEYRFHKPPVVTGSSGLVITEAASQPGKPPFSVVPARTTAPVAAAAPAPAVAVAAGDRKKVAVVVSLTGGGDRDGYVDCAAALAQSVELWRATSKFDVDLIAFLLPGLPKRIQVKMEVFGFQVREVEPPVLWAELEEGQYKHTVNKSGCCGFNELIKLNAYSLTQYHRVIHIDTDAMIMRNIDEIWDADPQLSLMYTPGAMPGEMFSGGLMIIRPELAVLEELKAVIRKGDFRGGSGWEGSGIGWYWGGQTIQGLMPFFYSKKMPASRSKTLDYCTHNCQSQDRCSNTPWADVKIWQFSICQKPFKCGHPKRHLCPESHNKWWELTWKKLDSANLPHNRRCEAGEQYTPITLNRPDVQEWTAAPTPSPTPIPTHPANVPFEQVICDGFDASFACSSGSVLRVDAAFYGTKAGDRHCDPKNPNAETCGMDPSASVKALCEGKDHCAFQVNVGNLARPAADPCPGVHKHAHITMTCVAG